MGMLDFGFHHFGLAARDPARAEAFLRSLGYHCSAPLVDELQGVELRWCTKEGAPPVEVVSSGPEGEGPLTRILMEQGTSFYHLCFEIPAGLDDALARLAATGIRSVTVRGRLPAVLFGGRLVSFHMVQGFGLVEFIEPAGQSALEG